MPDRIWEPMETWDTPSPPETEKIQTQQLRKKPAPNLKIIDAQVGLNRIHLQIIRTQIRNLKIHIAILYTLFLGYMFAEILDYFFNWGNI